MRPVSEDWQLKVSALVPCYNAEKFLQRTLDSLAAQTWPWLEILIGDDASTDRTVQVAREFVVNNANAQLIPREVNLGWLRNSNDLMGRATGELMFFAFHDDLIAPTYVEKLVVALNARPRSVLAFSDVEVINLDQTRTVWIFDRLAGLTSTLARGMVMARKPSGWWVPNRGVFRAEAFQRIGGIRPNAQGEYSADWTWLLHMSLLGEFVRVPEVLCYKFWLKGSLSIDWAHSSAQRAALRWAGVEEIRRSNLSYASKTLLILYILAYRFLPSSDNRIGRWIPVPVKRLLKRWIY
jgi:glycosyltransferase involved in cell wall biosynthesis